VAAADAIVVETPERVALSLEIADLGHRSLAFLADALILFLFWMIAVSVATSLRPVLYNDFLGLSSLLRAIICIVLFAANWAYDIAFETLWNGQTPGKRLMRIRVVRDDGSPEGFFEAVARNLCRIADLSPVYGIGVIAMIASPKGKRLGDHVAGTVVVRERRIDLSRYEVTAPLSGAPVTLSANEFELVTSFLARAPALDSESRSRVGRKLAEPIAARLPEAERAAVLASPETCEAFLHRVAGR
jgi:uncharacterized RDD family membrane protein YckC